MAAKDNERRDTITWFLGLVGRALEQGFEVVQIRRAVRGRPAALTGGYADDANPVVALTLDEGKLGAADPGAARTYFQARWREIGSMATPSTLPGAEPRWTKGDPIEVLARQFLELQQVAERAKDVRAQLLEEMQARGRTAIDVQGLGAVTLQPASTRQNLDAGGVRALVAALAAKLRELGHQVDDALPMKTSPVAASLRVTLAPA